MSFERGKPISVFTRCRGSAFFTDQLKRNSKSPAVSPLSGSLQLRQHSRSAEAAVNLVVGMFGINGASYAFPDEDDPRADHVHFYAIIRGRHNPIYVSRAAPMRGGFKFNVSNKFETLLTIGVVQRSPTQFDFYQITPSAISKFGTKTGAFVELNVSESGRDLIVKSEKLPRIEDIENVRREPVTA